MLLCADTMNTSQAPAALQSLAPAGKHGQCLQQRLHSPVHAVGGGSCHAQLR